MKICPYCQSVYADDMNYCLEHGVDLINQTEFDPAKTILRSEAPTQEYRGVKTGGTPGAPSPSGFAYSAPKSSRTYIFPVVVGAFGLLILIGLGFSGMMYIKYKSNLLTIETTTRPKTLIVPTERTPLKTPPLRDDEPKLKVETGERVDGSFGSKYLKCIITNISDKVQIEPKANITFYEKDIKVHTAWSGSDLKLLKPGESKPVWVPLPYDKSFDKAVAEDNKPTLWKKQGDEKIFPPVTMSDTAMKVEKATSMFNFRSYQEDFYIVTGIVENTGDEKLSPDIFVTYFDAKAEVVGYASTSAVEIEPGQKAKFKVQVGRTQIFGVPVKFEAIVFND